MRSCIPRLLLVSNCVAKGGWLASAPDTMDCALSDRAATRLSSFSIQWLRGAVTNARSASEQVWEPNSVLVTPLIATAPAVDTWYWTACCPAMKTALPDALMQLKLALALLARNWSPMRPPQPEVAPSGLAACHTLCWSLCEKSFGGKGTDCALYCAKVVGCTSVPTLSSTPILPASNNALSPPICGASAICLPALPSNAGALDVKAVAASASRAVARLWRIFWYSR